MQAGVAAAIAAKRVFEDPSAPNKIVAAPDYNLLWLYYDNAMFDAQVRGWEGYKTSYGLYRNIRLIYNPVRRLVDFYPSVIYPGVLSTDGQPVAPHIPSAIPFSDTTHPRLANAIAQFWQWSNWQNKKNIMVRRGAALGGVMVELVDDIERGKVTAEILWPGQVTALERDAAGNVKAYTLEYRCSDEYGSYVYTKQVDKEYYRFFRDGQPYNYGSGEVYANPYGFIPAVWVPHIDTGAGTGSPAIAGSLGKIDELNGVVSHIHDQIHKVIGAPAIMWTDGIVDRESMSGEKRRASRDNNGEQEQLLLLKGPKGGSVSSLVGNLDLPAAAKYMDSLMKEIGEDHPEINFYRELRSMSQLTGPAASRIVGDVSSRVDEAASNYDLASQRLFQMAVAIAGERAKTGAWGPLNSQQRKFLFFDLDSYDRGDLDLAIVPRPLIRVTDTEKAQEKQLFWSGIEIAVRAGVPLGEALRDAGWSEEAIVRVEQARMASVA